MNHRSIAGLIHAGLDLVYPRQCQVCGRTNHCDRYPFLCTPCFEEVPWIHPPCCERCGLPFHGKIESSFCCPNCREMSLHFDRATAFMRFRGVVRHAIHALKYERQRFWLRALQGWLERGLMAAGLREDVDVILPVPLHPVRERERGFNQAWFLAREISRRWGVPAHRQALARVRPTETQTHLDREERMANLRGAFAVRSPELVRDRRVLLVDDVLTTGSTANECARAVRSAGTTSILVFTLARG